MRLTDLAIKSLVTPPKGATIHLDDQITGFGVRVSMGGTKSFVLTYGTERKRITLGRYPIISLAQARDLARKHLAELTLGHKAPSIGFQTLVSRFLTEKKRDTRPKTFYEYERLLKRHLTLDTSLSDLTPHHLSTIFDGVEKAQERAHLINVVKMLFRYAERHQLVERSPAAGFSVTTPTERERVLKPEELKAIWQACGDEPFGRTVKLLMLTGQRKSEIQHIKVEAGAGTIAAANTKNKRQHTFALPSRAIALLAHDLSFNGWSKAKDRLDRQCGVEDWTLHDLRRTYATIHAQLGTPPHIIEALLNHASGQVSGVAAIYNRYTYLAEMKEAVSAFEKWFETVINGDCPGQ